MDKINDELLACYVDGIATAEEQVFVREYLAANPEEYERVLYMMDLDREDYVDEFVEDTISTAQHISLKESSITNIAYSVAAFAPQEKTIAEKRLKTQLKINGFQDRLNNILEEI